MGTIKDLVDLTNQLTTSVKDRKFARELRQIQSMIGELQSEHAIIHEQRINLMTENAELKQTNTNLQNKINELQQILNELQNPTTNQPDTLPEEAIKILVFISKNEYATALKTSLALNIDYNRTKYWLEELENQDKITAPRCIGEEESYSIIQKGRKYLIENDLIQRTLIKKL